MALTEAGDQLFRNLAPVLRDLDRALTDVGTLRDQPSGRLRINASEEAGYLLMARTIPTFLKRCPDIHLDLVTEGAFVDIVAGGLRRQRPSGESASIKGVGFAYVYAATTKVPLRRANWFLCRRTGRCLSQAIHLF